MTRTFKTALAAFALVAAVGPAAAQSSYSQFAANAGLTMDEAEGLSLAQIAQHHANRGESLQDQQAIPGWIEMGMAGDGATSQLRASARNMPGQSLREIAAIHSNQGASNADKITVRTPMPGAGSDLTQLAAAAGLDGAEGRDATEIAAIYFNRGESVQDAQAVRN